MKRVFLFAAMSLAIASPALAQTKSVKQAERIAKDDKPDFAQARSIIQPTLTNPETMNDARAWYVAGLIEEKQVDMEKINMSLSKPFDEVAFYSALYAMYPYYIKADSLDALPNEKGKVKRKFKKEIYKALSENHGFFVNAGSFYFDKEDYDNAHKFFKQYLNVKKLEMFQGTPIAEQDSMSMQIGFFSAYAASKMKDNLKNAIAEYEEIKNVDYRRNDVYQLLASAYMELGDSVNYERILGEGAAIFPKEKYFVFNLINIFVRKGEHEKAKVFLEKAIAQDPQNKQLYNVLATVYEQGFKDIAKAEEIYGQVLALDPTYAEAIIGLGRIYYNQAVAIQSEANSINDVKKYKAKDAEAKVLFKKALPYFEKAVELESTNTEYLMALRGIYYNLDMNDKMEEIEKRISQ
ncbi:lipopolysaccharide assembly protein LapB [Porphyromonas sp.]|uniref:tetratricopeptide repeat protein n=1 Tax=Porphyromonas sp. TaxID=1924944 RepID=UPI0026DC0F23|nr:hypothetical protein [Porphyromonas sp.]MDO4770901.1 hypothetical protein [Porphyromonas sp.]